MSCSQEPFDLLIFGGTGDLAMRKLLPSLFQAHHAGALHENGHIWGISRRALSCEDYRSLVKKNLQIFVPEIAALPEAAIHSFLQRLNFISCDAFQQEDFRLLADAIHFSPEKVLIAYLATSPHIFEHICLNLAAVGLNHQRARIVLEKPLGVDLASNQAINQSVAKFFDESQIYRIDHYQGKESVQNLLMMRFANVLFEPQWRREWIDHVQITIAESVGVGARGAFYDDIGALRDMVQNHLLQLLCMIAMEPPASLSPLAVRNEKLKVLQALKPFTAESVATDVVRGQYAGGVIDGEAVCGFHEELDIAKHSQTETFVALRTEIQNWRWAGVPFFLRTGKRMAKRSAEIVIQFRNVPHHLYPNSVHKMSGNRLVIHLQPEDSVRLHLYAKCPGNTVTLKPVSLDLDFDRHFNERRADAYERLLLDVIQGDQTLFVRRDEQEEAWRWVAPIIEAWEKDPLPPKSYAAGSWGPDAADELLARDGLRWYGEE